MRTKQLNCNFLQNLKKWLRGGRKIEIGLGSSNQLFGMNCEMGWMFTTNMRCTSSVLAPWFSNYMFLPLASFTMQKKKQKNRKLYSKHNSLNTVSWPNEWITLCRVVLPLYLSVIYLWCMWSYFLQHSSIFYVCESMVVLVNFLFVFVLTFGKCWC